MAWRFVGKYRCLFETCVTASLHLAALPIVLVYHCAISWFCHDFVVYTTRSDPVLQSGVATALKTLASEHGTFQGYNPGGALAWLTCVFNRECFEYSSVERPVALLLHEAFVGVAIWEWLPFVCTKLRLGMACRHAKHAHVVCHLNGLPWNTFARSFELPILVNQNQTIQEIKFWDPTGSGSCIGAWYREGFGSPWSVCAAEDEVVRNQLEDLLQDIADREPLPAFFPRRSFFEAFTRYDNMVGFCSRTLDFDAARLATNHTWPPLCERPECSMQ